MKIKPFILLPILAGAMWGSTGIFVRGLTDFGFDNISILGVRLIFSVIPMLIAILIKDRNLLKFKLKDFWIFACGAFIAFLGTNYCYNFAISYLSLSLAAVLLSMSPVFVVIMAAFIFKERISARKLICMFLAIVGCVLTSGIIGGSPIPISATGIFVGIAGAFFYGLTSILSKIAMNRGYSPLTMTFYSISLVAIVLIPFTDWELTSHFIAASPAFNVAYLLAHALITAVISYLIYNISLIYVAAGPTSILAAGAEPAAAMVFGIILFSEIPSIISIIGLIVTIAALTLLCLDPESKNQ